MIFKELVFLAILAMHKLRPPFKERVKQEFALEAGGRAKCVGQVYGIYKCKMARICIKRGQLSFASFSLQFVKAGVFAYHVLIWCIQSMRLTCSTLKSFIDL